MFTKALARRGEQHPSTFNDFFKPWDQWFDISAGNPMNALTIPVVNIVENKNNFEISLAAPGMKKEDFSIDVEGNLLTISAQTEEKKEEADQKYTRKEFSFTTFSRAFTLPDGLEKDKIDAAYENGLLKVVLPKTDAAKKAAAKHIAIH